MARSKHATAGGQSTQASGRHTSHVQRACDVCRAKRYKCDAARPSCAQCIASKSHCEYTARIDLRRNLNKEEAVALNMRIGELEEEIRRLKQSNTHLTTRVWQLTQQLEHGRGGRPGLPMLEITTTLEDGSLPSPYLSSSSEDLPLPPTPANQVLFSEIYLQVPETHHRYSVSSASSISDGDAEEWKSHDLTLGIPQLSDSWLYSPSSPCSSVSDGIVSVDGIASLELMMGNTALASPSSSYFDTGSTSVPVMPTPETYGSGEVSLFPTSDGFHL